MRKIATKKEEGVMFKFVHHIQYVVAGRDEFVAYLDRNFAVKSDEVE